MTTSVVQERREFGPRTPANLGLQQRWDVAKNLGFDLSIDRTATIGDPGWDMSVHGRVRHQTSGDEVSTGYGVSVGRVLVDNVWLSFGYNLVGFYDAEFSAADYTAQGPFFRIRAKFDQLSVEDAIRLFR